ncbi:MAG: membrane protein insertion efficiency factor YidD [Mycobacterium sp.]
MTAARGGAARLVISGIGIYRHMISPLRPASCRFMPTCSQYAVDAVSEYGVVRGGWLAIRRLLRCGPWCSGGWDPIPERVDAGDGSRQQLRSADV